MTSSSLPQTASGRRLSEVLRLIRTATPETVCAFVKEHYTEENAKREKPEKRIATFMDWRTRGGFEVLEILESREDYLVVQARQPYTDEYWRLALRTGEGSAQPIAALLLGRSPMPVIENPGSDEDTARNVLAYAARLAVADLFSGAVLVGRHGKILGQAAFGYANRDFDIENRIDTRFNVASLTKSWTAVAIAQLAEAGILSLQDPVSKFVDYPDRKTAQSTRVEHLLSHTSGLGDYFVPEFARRSRCDMRSVDDYLELCKSYTATFAAGANWKYSNVGMVLLGKIIEVVTGKDYFEHVKVSVLEKAGMSQSGFPELDFVNKDTAVGYHKVWSLEGPRYYNSLFEGAVRGSPAGCGYATVEDVFRFAEAFKADKLVGRQMRLLMTSPKPELGSPDYGFGFAIHPQSVLYGHSGGLIGASSNLDITAEPGGWVIVVLCNDLSMRSLVLKARQLIGVTVPEAEEGRAYLPHTGLSAR